MESYNSCLFPILQEIFGYISSEKYSKKHFREFICKYSVQIPQLTNIGDFIESIKELTSANEALDIVCSFFDSADSCDLCANCVKCLQLFYLSVCEYMFEDFSTSELAENKKIIETNYSKLQFRKPPDYLKYHLNSSQNLKQNYISNFENLKYERTIENNLVILKGMSSSSPYIYNEIYNANRFTGGGIYLRFNNNGIVVDPGYGFVDNMRRNKISISDINTVIITHDHIDHTNDMRILDDLNHQFQDKNHVIKWYIDKNTSEHLWHNYSKKTNECYVIENTEFSKKINITDKISIIPFKTEHIINECTSDYDKNTLGVVFELETVDNKIIKIGYTSDTRYYDGIEENLEKCDIIIANISSIYYNDYLLIKNKQKHLGYSGCYHILKKLKVPPKLFIVSEFWSGTTDLRYDVCKALKSDSNTAAKVIPGDIGLHIDILENKIKCSGCGKYEFPSKVFAVKPSENFKEITYICKDCLL